MIPNDSRQPVSLDAFEVLAERYATMADMKIENAYLDRPATISLLPEVAGKRVLDAGCGAGAYSAWLLEQGADVIAFDVSPKMVELAKERLGARAEVRVANLEESLDFLKNESIDIVLCALVLGSIRDLPAVFSEFNRVLRSKGYLVFSISHPFSDFKFSKSGNYYDTELLEIPWKGFGEPFVSVPWFRRPLTEITCSLTEAGFLIERLVEPRPVEDGKKVDPEAYETLSSRPIFMAIRAIKK